MLTGSTNQHLPALKRQHIFEIYNLLEYYAITV